jgi:hypothetical protein
MAMERTSLGPHASRVPLWRAKKPGRTNPAHRSPNPMRQPPLSLARYLTAERDDSTIVYPLHNSITVV